MKSKKSKQKEVKNKKIQKEKGINEIENDILSSPKNINLFNKLIEIFINNIENKDEEKIRETIADADLLIIFSKMGDYSATYDTVLIANLAKKMGILTIIVAMLVFHK